MFGQSVTLFRLFGIDIRLNFGWAIIAALIAWSLAQGVFPQLYEGLEASTYWWMALVAVIGLAVSIIAHELSHSLMAARFGTPVSSVTLFLFGGVASMDAEPKTPQAELFIALAGPAMSFVIAALFQALAVLSLGFGQDATAGVLSYLALLNLVLAIFNLLPAFPMDGGRALRALLWSRAKNFKTATRQASNIGKTFGLAFMALGLLAALLGNFIGGIWWILIGTFIRAAAAGSYASVQVRSALEGLTVGQLMTRRTDTVSPDLPLDRFVDEHVLKLGHDLFPVVESGRVRGVVGLKQAKALDRENWSQHRVGEVMVPVSDVLSTTPETPAVDALGQMQEHGLSRLVVADNGDLAGVIVLKDLMDLLRVRLALEEPA